MFHTSCMVQATPNIYQCKACHFAGVAVQSDSDEDNTSSSDDDDTVVEYEGLKLGMKYGQGTIGEIYPRDDKVVVHMHRDGGVEMQHLKVGKVLSKTKVS